MYSNGGGTLVMAGGGGGGGGTLVMAGGGGGTLAGSRRSLAGSVYESTGSLHGSNIVLFPVSYRDPSPQRSRRHPASLHPPSKPAVTADMAISNFHIEFDRGVALYHPGQEIKGKVIMDVWTPLSILYIEFKIQGYATIRQFSDSGDGFSGKPVQEYYINKRILLLSPQKGSSTLTLQQGKYVSEFSYKLSEELPPTVTQFDLGRGYVFDITYSAKANVCDLMKSGKSSVSSAKLASAVSRVVKTTKASFAISTPFELERSDEPIVHSEQIQLFCSPFNTDPTSVLVQLNKSTYNVGEYIRVHIELLTPTKKRVRKLIAELEQTVNINLGKKKATRFHQTLIKAVDDGQGRRMVPKSHEMAYEATNSKLDMIKTGFRLPIPPNFVPSYLPGCDIINNSYCIKVTVKFGRLGGELIERIPINIIRPTESTSSSSQEPSRKHNIPLFNKPIMQFPYFAKDSNARDSIRSNRSMGGASTDTFGSRRHNAKHERVSTQYKTCITCCGCCLLCLGYGIYD